MDSEKIKTKEFWNANPCEGKWSDVNKKIRYRYSRSPYFKEIIEKNIDKSMKVLEIGCGQGVDLSIIAKRTKHAFAIELSDKSLENAKLTLKKCNSKATLSAGDAENLQFKNDMFDVVYSCGVIHHTPNTEKAVEEIYRVLKPGGKAIIMVYSKYSLQYPIFWFLRFTTKPWRERLALKNKNKKINSILGTSVTELFGVPILKAYSKKQLLKMFNNFEKIELRKYQTGFYRLRTGDKGFLNNLTDILEKSTQRIFGFHTFVIATKPS